MPPGEAPRESAPLDPDLLVRSFLAVSFSEFLRHYRSVATVREDEIDGRRLVTVTIDKEHPVDHVPATQRFVLHFDPARSFIVPKSEISWKLDGTAGFLPTSVVEAQDWQEVVPGIWMPIRVHTIDHQLLGDGRYGFLHEKSVHYTDWQVNVDLPEGWCRLAFPKGLRVDDRVRGRRYNWEAITDASIEEIVREAERLAAELPQIPPPKKSNLLGWIVGIVVALLIAGSLLFLVRRWIRTGRFGVR
jgi:hypothetical protein